MFQLFYHSYFKITSGRPVILKNVFLVRN